MLLNLMNFLFVIFLELETCNGKEKKSKNKC